MEENRKKGKPFFHKFEIISRQDRKIWRTNHLIVYDL